MTWDNVIRILYGLMCTATVVLMVWRAFGPDKQWARYTGKVRDYWWALALWNVVIIVGVVEVMGGWGTDFRVILVLFASAVTLKGILGGMLNGREINSINGLSPSDEVRVRPVDALGMPLEAPGKGMYWDSMVQKWRVRP